MGPQCEQEKQPYSSGPLKILELFLFCVSREAEAKLMSLLCPPVSAQMSSTPGANQADAHSDVFPEQAPHPVCRTPVIWIPCGNAAIFPL